jgi:hypothetical protein
MKTRHRFSPETVQGLEPRVVLSKAAGFAPISPAPLTIRARNNAAQAVVNAVNTSFDSFSTDYLQAQGAYLAAPNGGSHNAFKSFVVQRVELLAAQLTRIFAHVPGSLSRLQTSSSGGPVVVQAFLRSRINGSSSRSLLRALEGGGGNPGAIPPVRMAVSTSTIDTIATIYTDQAISAIETARTASLNSVGFLYGKAFDKHR